VASRSASQNIRKIAFGKGHSICPEPHAQNTTLLDNCFPELDNNSAERAMKPVAMRSTHQTKGPERPAKPAFQPAKMLQDARKSGSTGRTAAS
jgi:hypothetical protein